MTRRILASYCKLLLQIFGYEAPMLKENIEYFIANYDFEMLMDWFSNVDPVSVILNPYVLVPLIIIVGMVLHPKTSAIGQNLVFAIPAIGFLFVTFVILRNDVISSIGPFIMAGISFFGIIGFLVYTQLLKGD